MAISSPDVIRSDGNLRKGMVISGVEVVIAAAAAAAAAVA